MSLAVATPKGVGIRCHAPSVWCSVRVVCGTHNHCHFWTSAVLRWHTLRVAIPTSRLTGTDRNYYISVVPLRWARPPLRVYKWWCLSGGPDPPFGLRACAGRVGAVGSGAVRDALRGQ